ncbi:MAG: two-component system, OmpR family, phosphate regulon sensor histidine kinase PhoR [Verrucomicrobiota bacterium]
MWPFLTIFAFAALAVAIVHRRWRQKYLRSRQEAQAEIQKLKERQQQQFAQTQAQQETLFNSMIEGLLLLDENERVQLANRAFTELFSITMDVRGKTILEVLRQHELTKLLQRVASEKQVLDYELKIGGLAERSLQINAAAMFDSNGHRQGTILVFHDLTRLNQLERTREEFVANVSHELRTPLSLIKGYVETLLDGAKDNPEVQIKFLQTIQRNAERLQFLIEDLLTISELESGRLKMNLQPIKLQPLVERVLEDHKSQANAKNVVLANSVPDLIAEADAERLQQVLGNLISNAIKYGRSEGRVKVSARKTNEAIELCVQDDGPGIPHEALERVFERFYRIDKARSRDAGGTGLGLSIVKHIVQTHGGRVWAKSELGKGTEFYFTIPISTAGSNSISPV